MMTNFSMCSPVLIFFQKCWLLKASVVFHPNKKKKKKKRKEKNLNELWHKSVFYSCLRLMQPHHPPGRLEFLRVLAKPWKHICISNAKTGKGCFFMRTTIKTIFQSWNTKEQKILINENYPILLKNVAVFSHAVFSKCSLFCGSLVVFLLKNVVVFSNAEVCVEIN